MTRLAVLLAVVLLASTPRPEPSPAIPGASSQSSISIDTSEDATGTLATARTGAPRTRDLGATDPYGHPGGSQSSPSPAGAPLIALGQGALTTGHASMCDNSGVGVSDENPYHG